MRRAWREDARQPRVPSPPHRRTGGRGRGPVRARLALVCACLAMLACSEKPRVGFVWLMTPASALPRRAALRGVAARTLDDAVAVGNLLPEHVVKYQPIALAKTSAGWVQEVVPQQPGASTLLTGAAWAADGAVWACGGATQNEDDPASTTPLLFCRRAPGVWESVDLDSLPQLAGTSFTALAVTGTGAGFELRAVGTRLGAEGVCLRLHQGTWSWMTVPPPQPGVRYGLAAVGRSPWGDWYAAGNNADGPGGAVYADHGTGWQSIAGPNRPALEFVSLSFDAAGEAWFAANDASGDVPEGVLYTLQHGTLVTVPITRRTAGAARLYAIGFNAQGYGWVGGGRPPDDPFFAGNDGGATWSEVIVDADFGQAQSGGEGSEGGEVMAITVLGKDAALAVGQVEETGPEGYLEQFPRVFEYQPVPAGDPDLPAGP
jgi:hypothetical protein